MSGVNLVAQIKRMRRKLAAIVAGEQPMLSLPDVDGTEMRKGNWQGMSDESIVATVRYGVASLEQITRRKANKLAVPLSVMTTADAAMSLIRHARDANAGTTTIHQRGEIAGEDVGAWQITITKAPDDFEFPEPGHIVERHEGERLVHLEYGLSIGAPDYHRNSVA